jgi:hypothetical protein
MKTDDTEGPTLTNRRASAQEIERAGEKTNLIFTAEQMINLVNHQNTAKKQHEKQCRVSMHTKKKYGRCSVVTSFCVDWVIHLQPAEPAADQPLLWAREVS